MKVEATILATGPEPGTGPVPSAAEADTLAGAVGAVEGKFSASSAPITPPPLFAEAGMPAGTAEGVLTASVLARTLIGFPNPEAGTAMP